MKRVLIVEDAELVLKYMISECNGAGLITEIVSVDGRIDLTKRQRCKTQVFLATCYEAALRFASEFTVPEDVSDKIKDVFVEEVLFLIDDKIPRDPAGIETEPLGRIIAEGLVENFGVSPESIYCTSSDPTAVSKFPDGCIKIDKGLVPHKAQNFINGEINYAV